MAKKRTKEPISQEYFKLGQILSELRTAAGWSQAEAAAKIGIPQSTYSGYETGSRRINLRTLSKLADIYEVSVNSLIGNVVETGDVSTDEALLIRLYRLADKETKDMVMKLLKISTQ